MTTGTVTQVRWAGPFMEGETPLPFTVKFDPTDIDFTGFTVDATLADGDNATLTFNGSVNWETITTGLVRVDLDVLDVTRQDNTLDKEVRRLVIWAGDGGTNKVATLIVKYVIDQPVGVPPSI